MDSTKSSLLTVYLQPCMSTCDYARLCSDSSEIMEGTKPWESTRWCIKGDDVITSTIAMSGQVDCMFGLA